MTIITSSTNFCSILFAAFWYLIIQSVTTTLTINIVIFFKHRRSVYIIENRTQHCLKDDCITLTFLHLQLIFCYWCYRLNVIQEDNKNKILSSWNFHSNEIFFNTILIRFYLFSCIFINAVWNYIEKESI